MLRNTSLQINKQGGSYQQSAAADHSFPPAYMRSRYKGRLGVTRSGEDHTIVGQRHQAYRKALGVPIVDIVRIDAQSPKSVAL